MKLKVRARGTAMVPHYEALGRGHRFIGRKFVPDAVEHTGAFVDKFGPRLDTLFGTGGEWVATDDVVEVPTLPEGHVQFNEFLAEYRADVQRGALWAADEATAKACGVAFNPSFGSEQIAAVS